MLEKSYFCSIANNNYGTFMHAQFVVICLKNRTFAVSQTTFIGVKKTKRSCDLLEKSYFCSIANNKKLQRIRNVIVVICLKNRTFAVSQTTSGFSLPWTDGCDLLEKSYFCSIANNSNKSHNAPSWVVICLKNRTFAVSQTTSCYNLLVGFAL